MQWPIPIGVHTVVFFAAYGDSRGPFTMPKLERRLPYMYISRI